MRGVNVRAAAQHGLGVYELEGWVSHCSVDAASTSSPGDFNAAHVAGAYSGSRLEDVRLHASDCDHAVQVLTGNIRIGGIDVLSDPVNSVYDVPPDTVWSRAFMAPFSVGGELGATPGTFKLPILYPSRIIGVRAAVDIAPTGASILVDVNKNGTTIFTTQANRPAVAATTVVSPVAFPDIITADPGDYLTVDIDQVGSTTPGETLTVVVLLENDQA